MEEKIFELMEKMYSGLMGEISSVKQEVKTLGNQVARLENDLKPKVEAALDGYKIVFEKLNTLESKVDNINEKVEKQEVEIKVIKGGR